MVLKGPSRLLSWLIAGSAGHIGEGALALRRLDEPRNGERAKGKLAKKTDAERMADFCIASMQGAMLMDKIRRSSQTVETTVREALAHLKSYFVKAGL